MESGPAIVWRRPGAPRTLPTPAFLPLIRAAADANSSDRRLLLNLVVALGAAGQWHEIIDRLAPLAANGLGPELLVELGAAALHCGDVDRAGLAFAKAADQGACEGQDSSTAAACRRARVELASLLRASGRDDEALHRLSEALDRHPQDDAALAMTADLMLAHGDGARLLPLLDTLEARGVRSPLLLASRANALGATGAHAELERLVSPGDWCARMTIAPDRIDNRRLAEVILAHPALETSPGDRATLGRNQRLDAIASRDEPEIQAIVAIMREHVDAYVAKRRDAAHPLMAGRPDSAVLQGWALATEGDGHEARHIHPRGWLTAVYYVSVPPIRPDTERAPPGSIMFGPWPAASHPCEAPFSAWHFEPRPGMLLIFPSFLAHGTLPADVQATRLCVTLDVMPCSLRA